MFRTKRNSKCKSKNSERLGYDEIDIIALQPKCLLIPKRAEYGEFLDGGLVIESSFLAFADGSLTDVGLEDLEFDLSEGWQIIQK